MSDENPFQVATRNEQAVQSMSVAQQRAVAEVQGAMVVAKKFPRDQNAAYAAIIQSCRRPSLAEAAIYSYPRGGTKIEGPSIRLAESIAQNWGNIDFGIIELSQADGESTVMAYAIDLQTNTRQTKVFCVPHVRRSGKQNVALDDPRDVYEMVANQGARRLRACILGVIPGDIVDAAVEECNKTLQGKSAVPLADRIRQMVTAFSDFGVSQAMLEMRLKHKIDATSETELVSLKKIYVSLRDGMSKREDWFDPSLPAAEPQTGKVDIIPPEEAPKRGRKAKQPEPEPEDDVPMSDPEQEQVQPPHPADEPQVGPIDPGGEPTPDSMLAAIRANLDKTGITEQSLVSLLVSKKILPAGYGLDTLTPKRLGELCMKFPKIVDEILGATS